MLKLKNILILLSVSIVLLWLNCSTDSNPVDAQNNVDNTDFVATETFSFDIPLVNHTQFRMAAINGNVLIKGKTGIHSVLVSGEKSVGSESLEDAQAHLDLLEVIVENLTSEVYAHTSQPENTQGRLYTVHYTITLPEYLQTMVAHVNGTVSIDSVKNTVTVNNANGQIILNDIKGSAWITLINGNIYGKVTLPLDGMINMTTTNGGLELAIPRSTSAEFTAMVNNGVISISNLDLKNQTSSTRSVSGTLGEGQGTIQLNNVNGNISVSGF